MRARNVPGDTVGSGGKPVLWFVDGQDIRLRLPLLLAMRERGYDVAAAGSEDIADFAAHDIPYHRYTLRWDVSPLADLRSLRDLVRLFRRHRPDIVHAYHTKPAIYAPLAASKAGIRGIVRTVTGLGHLFSSDSFVAGALRPVYRTLQKRASAASTVTVFQNDDDRAYFLEHNLVRPDRVAVVRSSGIDPAPLATARDPQAAARLRRELNLDGEVVVTMVARLLKHKGIQEFLDAARIVRAVRRDVVFLLVGPPHPNDWKGVPVETVQAPGSGVRYLGVRRDVPALLGMSNMFVLPTYYREGVPRVLLEAGAAGLPLITTDMPGCRDIVRDGWNGLLVAPRDGAAVARAVLRLADAKDERAAMGERGRRLVLEEHMLARIAEAQDAIYRRILDHEAPGTRQFTISPGRTQVRPDDGLEHAHTRSQAS